MVIKKTFVKAVDEARGRRTQGKKRHTGKNVRVSTVTKDGVTVAKEIELE